MFGGRWYWDVWILILGLLLGAIIYSMTFKPIRDRVVPSPRPESIDTRMQDLKRWEQMCQGPERYDAMREASDAGRPNPC